MNIHWANKTAELSRMKRILLLEDSEQTSEWLSGILSEVFDDAEIYTASTLFAARQQLKQHFDLAVLDINLPDGNGIDIARELLASQPKAYVIIATVYDDDKFLFEALKIGIQGYILKGESTDDIKAMLSGVVNDDPPLSPPIARRILKHFSQSPPHPSSNDHNLTPREVDVLTLIAKGYSRKEIAKVLGITHNTVSGYIKTMYGKLSISSQSEAALEAARLGLIKVPTQTN